MEIKNPYDKILGCLVGCGLGDALGLPHEFKTSVPVKKYTGKLEFVLQRYNRFKDEIKHTVVGQISDDTEMMLMLCDVLIEQGEYSRVHAIMQYKEWANHRTSAFMGKNTRDIFQGVTTVKGVESRITRLKTREESQSNGALMRCAILAIVDNIKYALVDCELTNPHEVCIETNRMYLGLVRKAFQGFSKKRLMDWLESTPTIEVVRTAITSALLKRRRDVTKLKGWCIHGIYCAVYALFHFNNFQTGIDWVIRLGGDTDTNGAIAGALMGVYYGFKELEKCEKKNIAILFECDTSRGDFPRKEKWTMAVAKDYALMLSDIFQK